MIDVLRAAKHQRRQAPTSSCERTWPRSLLDAAGDIEHIKELFKGLRPAPWLAADIADSLRRHLTDAESSPVTTGWPPGVGVVTWASRWRRWSSPLARRGARRRSAEGTHQVARHPNSTR